MPRRAKPKVSTTCAWYRSKPDLDIFECGYVKLPIWVDTTIRDVITPSTLCNACKCYKKIKVTP